MNSISQPMAPASRTAPALTRYAWLSVVAALATITLKVQAYWITGSVGLLSDAAESLVNLVAACFALGILTFAARPADECHPFGHGKAEYFSSAFEGALIMLAAAGIAWAAGNRLLHPQPLAALNVGIAISTLAGLINLAVALILLKAGRRYRSITLEADGKHLLTDVWTTLAILLALGGIALTGWQILDPLIAFLAAVQIVWTGMGLMARSVSGLLDAAIPEEERKAIDRILDRYRAYGVEFHDLRARVAGTDRLMTLHVLVPGRLTVQAGHDLLERIEEDIRAEVHNITIVTHIEPIEDHSSFSHDHLASAQTETPTETAEPAPRHRGKGRFLRWAGAFLLITGSVASMLMPDFYADIALGISLLGLILFLNGRKKIPAG